MTCVLLKILLYSNVTKKTKMLIPEFYIQCCITGKVIFVGNSRVSYVNQGGNINYLINFTNISYLTNSTNILY